MKTISVVLGFLFVSAAALPAAASTQAVKSDPAAARSTVVQDGVTGSAQPRLICRRQETTGARTGGERICLTRDQWRVVNSGGSVTIYQKRAR